jgi:hypothetical protein
MYLTAAILIVFLALAAIVLHLWESSKRTIYNARASADTDVKAIQETIDMLTMPLSH